MPGWPFWAATSDERIELALDLAALSPGERFLDLGCGDGRVLLRAARERGALVGGVELDPTLAAQARVLLEENGVAGTVLEADFAEVPLDADVVFAYLSPATLQRLIPRLHQLPPGARVVTTGYAIPGWLATAGTGGCYLYRVPVEVHEVDRTQRGWATAGLLLSLRPEMQSLVTAKLHHGGGPVVVRLVGGLAGVAAARAGADVAEAGDEVVVDLRFTPLAKETSVEGSVEVEAPPPGDGPILRVFAVVDPGEPGIWGLSESGCEDVATAMTAGRMAPVLETARNLSQAPRQPAGPSGLPPPTSESTWPSNLPGWPLGNGCSMWTAATGGCC
ncbi:MAG: class I SAM-dependent methyltransferase [Actinomycetota bacterium]|nr:class I SAM-dependent methyltransferase [Actinomycetota bacterium]